MTFDTTFNHVFQPGKTDRSPLLLLHGTGGNEHDLLSLASAVAPGRTLLSVRGQVLENGMPRFFRRFAEGRFDEADLRQRAADLAGFISKAQAHYGMAKPLALGYSNGANMAAALLALVPDVLAGAVLLRAMVPLQTMPAVSLQNRPVLLLTGALDQMIPQAASLALARWLETAGAKLSHHNLRTGHGLAQTDLTLTTQFLGTPES
jgi:phospholipase/carboxylesterase